MGGIEALLTLLLRLRTAHVVVVALTHFLPEHVAPDNVESITSQRVEHVDISGGVVSRLGPWLPLARTLRPRPARGFDLHRPTPDVGHDCE